jgi:hypothetical protein
VVEDLHWLDPTSREVLDNLMQQVRAAAIAATSAYSARARTQGVPMLALRVAMSEARLGLRTGVLDATAAQLRTALGAVAEQDGSYDFVAARDLAHRVDGCIGRTARRSAKGLA